MARDDDYARQMKEASEREAARTAAEGNCTARTKEGDLCRRRVPNDLATKGISKCRRHASGPGRPSLAAPQPPGGGSGPR